MFEKEYVDIPMDDIGIDQGFIPSFAQNIIDQDNIGSLHTRNCSRGINCTTSKIYVIKKIHRKTEKCNANDYIVFLQDNEVDIKVMEDDRSKIPSISQVCSTSSLGSAASLCLLLLLHRKARVPDIWAPMIQFIGESNPKYIQSDFGL